MSDVNILFYSRKCPTCAHLRNILANENLLCFFREICVDDNINNLPKDLHTVPTLIVKNMPKQLEVEECFKWVQTVKFMKHQNEQNFLKNNTKRMAEYNRNGPIGWVDQEMGGFSDMFAYTNIDKPQAHSYVSVGAEDANVIFTAPEQGKMKRLDQDNQINELLKQRKECDQNYSELMKQQQLQAVALAEQKAFFNSQNPMNHTFRPNSRNININDRHIKRKTVNIEQKVKEAQARRAQQMKSFSMASKK